eukprot:CAMPEP_0184721656 /NCGR_PEP_ID=MMETSP0314-20130426/19297_1 /TAXON_ID=38298 /ORGANISM="Rhodella maculata, Strain CCMP 736" /LENGTH=30 /DNA_ID= /DNA_START= /DNA_END= /DNA_ORIENTATION=
MNRPAVANRYGVIPRTLDAPKGAGPSGCTK